MLHFIFLTFHLFVMGLDGKQQSTGSHLHQTGICILSAQAWHEKATAIHALVSRALHYCSTEPLIQTELARITDVFIANEYPLKAIQNIIALKTHKTGTVEPDEDQDDQQDMDFSKVFYAPYHPLARKMFLSLQKSFGIKCIYKKTTTLGNFLSKRRPKNCQWDTSHVVYSVPCEFPHHQYIGQTKRMMRVRIKEHEKSCNGDLSGIQPDLTNDHGVPYHRASTGNTFLFDQSRILAVEKHAFRRRIIEGINICNKEDSCVNIISGSKIDTSWAPIIKSVQLS